MAWTTPTATARRDGLDGDEIAFVLSKKAQGFPDFAVANMIGRNIELVRRVEVPPELVARPKPEPVVVILTPRAKAKARAKGAPEWRQSFPRAVRMTLERIAEKHGLTVADLTGPDRTRKFVHPRQEAMHELFQLGPYSLERIGRYLGGRDHTTVRHGVLAHEARTTCS